jgi:dihydroxyacetone kinase-like protein
VSDSDTVTLAQLGRWLTGFRDLVHQHADHLTALDAAIGDADHGSNLTRGTDAVVAALDPLPATAGELLKKAATALVSTVGGASGPLYGTFFLRAGAEAGDATTLDAPALLAALQAGSEGVVARGKAARGDKTMYDALAPAVRAFADGVEAGEGPLPAAARAAAAAAEARDATAPLEARKGRASYLGERSVGHVDPGAASTALLFEALERALGPDTAT